MEAILGILGTVLGTFLGFALSEWATRGRESREEGKRKKSVRTLISIEIDQNRDLLLALQKDVHAIISDDLRIFSPYGDLTFQQIATRIREVEYEEAKSIATSALHPLMPHILKLANIVIPLWSHKFWESQLTFSSIALGEKEISDVHMIHFQLDNITAIHHKLISYFPREVDLDTVERFEAKNPDVIITTSDFIDQIHSVLTKRNPMKAAA